MASVFVTLVGIVVTLVLVLMLDVIVLAVVGFVGFVFVLDVVIVGLDRGVTAGRVDLHLEGGAGCVDDVDLEHQGAVLVLEGGAGGGSAAGGFDGRGLCLGFGDGRLGSAAGSIASSSASSASSTSSVTSVTSVTSVVSVSVSGWESSAAAAMP